MTLVVYHRGVLAADVRVSYPNLPSDDMVSVSKIIKIPPKTVVNGDTLLAMGFAGSAVAAKALIAEIQSNPTPVLTYLISGGSSLPTQKGVVLLIIGKKNIYIIKIFDDGEYSRYICDKVGSHAAIGSGDRAALALLAVGALDTQAIFSVCSDIAPDEISPSFDWLDLTKPNAEISRLKDMPFDKARRAIGQGIAQCMGDTYRISKKKR